MDAAATAMSCLPPSSAFFALRDDEAIARALHLSMSDASPSPSPSSPSSSSFLLTHLLPTPPPNAARCNPFLVPDSPAARGGRGGGGLGARAGRVGKRRQRASRRTPTTYISTDAASFRLMVQQVTGVQGDPGFAAGVQPAFDAASGLLMDAAPPPPLPPPAEMSAQAPCFPTLDSWNVMYEHKEVFLN